MHPIHFFPPESLAPYISFYGIIDVGEDVHEPYITPPLGLCSIMIHLEAPVKALLDGRNFMDTACSAAGQVTSPIVGEIKGRTKTLMVFIKPGGMYQLFGIDMSALTNSSMPLSRLLGADKCAALVRDLGQAASHESMVQVMNKLFLSLYPFFEIMPKVRQAIDYIHFHKGNVTVKELQHNCFITLRSLERHFQLYVGLSPKDYAKIFRFRCLMNYIRDNPRLSWPKLCEQNGYYDQSHLTRDFTRYMKIKPRALADQDPDFVNYLLQE